MWSKKPLVFSSKSSEYLAELIIERLNGLVERGSLERFAFPDGERYIRIEEVEDWSGLLLRPSVYISATNYDEDFLELLRAGMAFSGYGATRIVFVVPFLGYSTMERAKISGEVVTAKTNLRLMSAIPNSADGNVFMFMDLHVSGLLHYFEGPSLRKELYAEEILVKGLENLGLRDIDNLVFGTADLGRVDWVSTFAKHFETSIVLVRKSRDKTKTQIHEVIGDVKDKCIVIYDDMVRSGGSLIKAADVYLENGAERVIACISHLALTNEEVVEKINASSLERIISTNTHPHSMWESVQRSEKFDILDVSEIFAEGISKVLGLVPLGTKLD